MSTSPRRYRLLDLALERRLLPDPVLRTGALYGAWARERRESRGGVRATQERLRELVAHMSHGPIAEQPDSANEQHYGLPPAFLGLILGPRRKYSGCLWEHDVHDLAGAEEAMLALTCRRARVADGMRILDLGCGWGSLALWLAERYPAARITAVSNSARQREWIEAERNRRAISEGRLEVITADVNTFVPSGRFDRVVSVEMFEHMRNWQELLRRIAGWLEPERGLAFVHVFSHRTLPYRFQGTWAAERFFTAGLMPGHELLLHFQRDLRVLDTWIVPGTHYSDTLRAWLANLDARPAEAVRVLTGDGLSERAARRLIATWRLFLISTEVIWRYRKGNRWLVSHYLLGPRQRGD